MACGSRCARRTIWPKAPAAASLAAAMKLRDRFAGRTSSCVMSGGNIDFGRCASWRRARPAYEAGSSRHDRWAGADQPRAVSATRAG